MSAFNLLTLLATRGHLFEPRPKGGYDPLPRWPSLIDSFQFAEPLSDHVVLEALVGATAETASLVAGSGTQAEFVDVVELPHAMRYTAKGGKAVPIVASASGRALLSQRTDGGRASVLKKAVFFRHTIGMLMSAETIEHDLRRAGRRGWFVRHSAFLLGLVGIALPVALPGRSYGLLIAGPKQRLGARYDKVAKLAGKTIYERIGKVSFAGAPEAKTA